MAGKWTELWDDERQKWVRVFIDLPNPLTKGTATTGQSAKPPTLYGPDKRPISQPARRFGFQKRSP